MFPVSQIDTFFMKRKITFLHLTGKLNEFTCHNGKRRFYCENFLKLVFKGTVKSYEIVKSFWIIKVKLKLCPSY